MYNNVPSDWRMYYRTCSKCGGEYHASEGGCDYCIQKQEEEMYRKQLQEENENN